MQSNNLEIVYARASWPMHRYGWSRTTLWRHVKAGRFPAPCYLPGGQRRWRLAELLTWESEHLRPGRMPTPALSSDGA